MSHSARPSLPTARVASLAALILGGVGASYWLAYKYPMVCANPCARGPLGEIACAARPDACPSQLWTLAPLILSGVALAALLWVLLKHFFPSRALSYYVLLAGLAFTLIYMEQEGASVLTLCALGVIVALGFVVTLKGNITKKA